VQLGPALTVSHQLELAQGVVRVQFRPLGLGDELTHAAPHGVAGEERQVHGQAQELGTDVPLTLSDELELRQHDLGLEGADVLHAEEVTNLGPERTRFLGHLCLLL